METNLNDIMALLGRKELVLSKQAAELVAAHARIKELTGMIAQTGSKTGKPKKDSKK